MCAIRTTKLAKTGLVLSELGLGCASLAGSVTAVPELDARATIVAARQAGIAYFDTAPFYGHGLSERFVGEALRGHAGLTLSSKVGRLLRPGNSIQAAAWPTALPFSVTFDYSYDGIKRSFDDSLQRLGLDHINILYIHDIGSAAHGAEVGPALYETAMTGGYRARSALRASGAVDAIGLGVNEAAVCLATLDRGDWDVFLLAGRYTLLEQHPLEDLFPACERAGTDVVLGGPFNSGILAGGRTYDYGQVSTQIQARVAGLARVCAAHAVPLAAAALRFPTGHKLIKSVIPGPRTSVELAQILEWWNIEIPDALWRDLKSEGMLRVDAPTP